MKSEIQILRFYLVGQIYSQFEAFKVLPFVFF